MAKSKLQFSSEDLARAADDGSWARGVGYFRGGHVISLMIRDGAILARVEGGRDCEYRVKLWTEGGEVCGECTCPMGDDGVICKHCVAVGLAYLADDGPESKDRESTVDTGDGVRAYLATQEKEALIELIMDRLPWDDELRRMLEFRAASCGDAGPDISVYRKAITDATRVGRDGFVDYRSAGSFTRKIDAAIDRVQELLADGYAAETVTLVEHAVARCEKAIGHMDDSDGGMGGVLHRLGGIHHAACLAAKPDPEDLARRLFRMELSSSWDSFSGAAAGYADMLGEKGLTVYRTLAEAQWKKLPALAPGDSLSYEDNRFTLTSMMESLAEASGDVEQLVAVMSKDLSSAYQFLQIAEVCRKAGRADDALNWAQRGLKAFAKDPDDRLEAFVADEYHRRGLHDRAMSLMWKQFKRNPHLHAYRRLKGHAEQEGQWPTWRAKALELVEKVIGKAMRQPRKRDRWSYAPEPDHSLLVEIYLWENDVDAAWAEAKAGGCREGLWMELAKLREADHPEDAAAIYRDRIGPLVNLTNNGAYEEATALLRKTKDLMSRLGQDGEFTEFLISIRITYKRKRNFMKMTESL